VRLRWAYAIACIVVAGCFADLGGFSGDSDAGTPDASHAGDDAPATPPAPPGPLPPPAPPPLDAGTDASDPVVFSDTFDDGVPLPRSWSSVHGAPLLASVSDAPSAPAVLETTVDGDGGTTTFLQVDVPTPAATRISCSFAVQLVQGSPENFTVTASLEGENGVYVRLDLDDGEWHYYGQYSKTGEYGGQLFRKMIGVWARASLTLETNGTVTVIVNDERLVSTIPPFGVGQLTFRAGILNTIAGNTLVTRYDDVRCTAR
jgi:hypothetical protein